MLTLIMQEDIELSEELYSYHIVKLSFCDALRFLFSKHYKQEIQDLIFSQTFSLMKLGENVLNPFRYRPNRVIFFARWENQKSLTNFLKGHRWGLKLAQGWHITMKPIRSWGEFSG